MFFHGAPPRCLFGTYEVYQALPAKIGKTGKDRSIFCGVLRLRTSNQCGDMARDGLTNSVLDNPST